jgi:ammonium transporter Rh
MLKGNTGGKKPQSVEMILDWLEKAAQAKMEAANADVTPSWASSGHLKSATILLGVFQIFLLVMFAICAYGGETLDADSSPGSPTQAYNMFCGVAVMMFVGFGYLMTFMKWHGLTAVGFTMLVTAMGLQWAVLTESFFDQWMNNYPDWHYVSVNIYSLLGGLYAVSSVLITFGGLIGKITPYQMVIVAIIELCLHSLNYKCLILGPIHVADMGGTYIDHLFGAYFGLSVAWVLGKPTAEPAMGAVPDVFSLIGTVFLWIYWPSFVAGAAEADSDQQQRAIVYTILALSSSTITAFFTSSFLNKNAVFRPVDIQNATLAGGVSIGCVANLTMNPAVAIFIGIGASLISTAGYYYVQPYLEENWGIHDTCGINNLHGMTAIFGAIVSVIVAGVNKVQDQSIYDVDGYDYATGQWWRQLVGLIVVFAYSVFTGVLTGYILKFVAPTPDKVELFHDNQYWEVADDYGRTFWSELGLVVDGGKKDDLDGSAHAQTIIKDLDTSGHEGRRRGPAPFEVPASAVINENEKSLDSQA